MILRKAKTDDLPDILRVVGEARAFMGTLGIDQWQDGYPEPETLAEDIRLQQLYVIEDNGGIAACAVLTLAPEPAYDAIDGAWRTGGPSVTIHRIALDDAPRGGGLAGRMVREAENVALAHGCASVRADTHRGNLAMRRFLEKQGFEFCGEVLIEVRQGDPVRVAYEKPL